MVARENKDRIKYLMDKIRLLEQTEKNRSKKVLWESDKMFGLNHWRSIPKKCIRTGKVPIIIELENEFWARILGIDFFMIHTDPVMYLIYQLEKKIKKFDIIGDDTPVSKTIPIFLGAAFEPAIFGQKVKFCDNTDPIPDSDPMIKSIEDLESIGCIDFYDGDMMKKAHFYYETISELVESDFEVLFPEFARSPIAVAMHIRGMENLLCDMMIEPDFAEKLIRFVADTRDNWWNEYSSYLKKDIPRQNIMNDEVNTPFLSPQLYMEYAFPNENTISDKYGVKYWHSCGDTSELIDCIKKIGVLDVFHVGPWTDLKQAVNKIGVEGTALEVCTHPYRDIIQCKNPLEKIKEIIDTCGSNIIYNIRSDTLQSMNAPEKTLKVISEWIAAVSPLLIR